MRAWNLPHFGLTHLQLVDLPDPHPGPHDVVVEVKAVALNYRDLLMVRGAYDPRVPLPLVPCSDGSGVVVARGSEVDLDLGTSVVPAFATGWLEGPPDRSHLRTTLGGPLPGTLARRIVVPAAAVVTHQLPHAHAATLPCAGVTAWNALQVIGDDGPVLTLGTGGVSTFVLQLARARGQQVFVASSSPEKRARVEALGGTWIDRTGAWGRGLEVAGVVELGGVTTLEQSMRACRAGGTIALIGVLGGERAEVSLTRAVMFGLRIQGIMVGSRQHLAGLIADYDQVPEIHTTVPFDAAPEAFAILERGGHHGKIVITMDG